MCKEPVYLVVLDILAVHVAKIPQNLLALGVHAVITGSFYYAALDFADF
jgi:hypothetical protein